MIAISSCLTGIPCRYNAKDSYNSSMTESVGDNYITICPEMLAEFSVPRAACEIVGGSGEDVLEGSARIIDKNCMDITKSMIQGAEQALQICLENNISKAYLKSNSPTCGCGKIYDGSFSNALKSGNGVFAALLIQHGIEVVSI